MTKEHFNKMKWGADMVVKYVDSTKESFSELVADVISVDFETCTIGVELPITKDLVFLPCEKCNILVDFNQK